MIRSELYQTRIDEYENMETAALMLMTSKEEKLDSWTSGLLKQAAKLLCETTSCCRDTLNELKSTEVELGSERLLRAIFMSGKDDNDDPDDEAD